MIGLSNIDSEDEGFSSAASYDKKISHKSFPDFEKFIEECLELINEKIQVKAKS